MTVRIIGPDSAEIHTTKTAATGTNWAPLSPNISARSITIFNTTGTILRVKRTVQTATTGEDLGYMLLPDGASRTFGGLKLADGNRSSTSLSIKRNDESNTRVDVPWEAESA